MLLSYDFCTEVGKLFNTRVFLPLCTTASQTVTVCASLKTEVLQFVVGMSMKRTFRQALRRKG